ncbi:hypothetical protein QFC20_006259 [Naganishia adeliensis]|uniref:Uncharacterized protein n=1 Tax=Naganishia adeliensis TaxID=92952 RepID=A0ACC2VD65_9TREE|nr:hypothetical protein QFC20_006259 [Naganishia adeliensis]
MNLNFNFPDLVADPSYSFAPTGTVLPSFRPSAFTNTARSRDDDARRYDVELRRVLAGQTEGLEVQEERVYRAEGNIRDFGSTFLLPPGRRQTQAEAEIARSRSPTVSDGHAAEGRQEDNQADVSELPTPEAEEEEDEEDEGDGERDLDDDMEDRDASYGSGDGDASG